MTMGETQVMDSELQEEHQQDMMEGCVPRSRRNAMWNIFEGVDEEAVLQNLAGLSLEVVQQLVHDTVPECLSRMAESSSPSSSASSDGHPCRVIRRSSSTTDGEEMQAALQNRQRRNAVGNLLDLLTPAQKLLLVEHLQDQIERLHGLHHADVSEDKDQVVLSLADLATSTTSSPQSASSSSSSTVSSPRSQGEIVCR